MELIVYNVRNLKAMNVWIENPFDNLPTEGFRPQRYWLMAEAFARAGYNVVLWTADFNHTTKAKRIMRTALPQNFTLRLLNEPPYRGNVSIGRMISHWRYSLEWEKEAMSFAEGNVAKPDVIIASTPPLSTGIVARRLAAKFGAKLVIDVMDAWPETFERVVPRWMLYPLRRIARANYRGADAITVVADRYTNLVRDYGLDGTVRCFYHGIDMSSIAPRTTYSSSLRLAYAGNLGRTYDLATVVRALAELPDATFDIAGKGEGEAPLKALVAELGLGSRVRFRGYLGGDALAAMLAECDAGVIPMDDSSCVGVPYKLCDYAKAGLAIVSSLGGESAKLLAKHGAGVTYRASDVASLIQSLRRLEASKAGPNALKMASEEFDARAIYDQYVQFVAKMA